MSFPRLRSAQVFSLFRSLHAWGGFLLALLIMLISLTGSMLVWKREYLWVSLPEARDQAAFTPEIAADIVAGAQRQFAVDDILLIQFQSENLSLHKIFLRDSRYAYLDNSGDVVDEWYLNGRAEEWLYDLHHRLLLGNTGLVISGLATLVLLGLLVPALIAWWPTRRGFRWQIWVSGLRRPQLLATHRNLGVISLIPISAVLVTAVILSFPDQAQEVLVAPHQTTQAYSELYVETLDELSGPENATLEASFQRAITLMSGARLRSLQLPGYSGYYLIGLQKQGDWHPGGLSRVYIDAESGRMDMSLDIARLPTSERFYQLSYPLHTGKVDSLIYRLLLTLVGLSIFILSFLGFVSFLEKRRFLSLN